MPYESKFDINSLRHDRSDGIWKNHTRVEGRKKTGALLQSLDGAIKVLNEPIGDLAGYERLMPKALDKT